MKRLDPLDYRLIKFKWFPSMKKAALIALSCPGILGSMLVTGNPAHAVDKVFPAATAQDSVLATKVVAPQNSHAAIQYALVGGTESDKEAAIKKFGCGCGSCISRIRSQQDL